MLDHTENSKNSRTTPLPDNHSQREQAAPIRRPKQSFSFPPGDLDDLIFYDSYPLYHSER